jgi:uncharacterized protein YjbI with pentapeptide repeats
MTAPESQPVVDVKPRNCDLKVQPANQPRQVDSASAIELANEQSLQQALSNGVLPASQVIDIALDTFDLLVKKYESSSKFPRVSTQDILLSDTKQLRLVLHHENSSETLDDSLPAANAQLIAGATNEHLDLSDVSVWGGLLFHALTGQRLAQNDANGMLANDVLLNSISAELSKAGVKPALATIVRNSFADDSGEHYSHPEELYKALLQLRRSADRVNWRLLTYLLVGVVLAAILLWPKSPERGYPPHSFVWLGVDASRFAAPLPGRMPFRSFIDPGPEELRKRYELEVQKEKESAKGWNPYGSVTNIREYGTGAVIYHSNEPTMTNSLVKRALAAKANLRGADLEYFDLSDCNFKGLDLRGAHLKRTALSRADFTGCDLRGASISMSGGTEVKFDRANLTDSSFEHCFLERSSFEDTRFDGTRFSLVDLSGAKAGRVSFQNCRMDVVNIDDSNLEGATFSHSQLTIVSFNKAMLSPSNFDYASISNGCFQTAHMRASDFQGARLFRCDFIGTKLEGVLHRGTTVINCRYAFPVRNRDGEIIAQNSSIDTTPAGWDNSPTGWVTGLNNGMLPRRTLSGSLH